MIEYSDEFAAKAKELFPSWEKLNEAIANNEESSVRIAIGDIKVLIEPEEVVKAFQDGQLKSLLNKAKHLCAVKELENMWYTEYDKSSEDILQRNQISKLEQELFAGQ